MPGGIQEPTCAGSAPQPAYAGDLGKPRLPGTWQSPAPSFPPLCPFLLKDYMRQQISSGGQSPPSCLFLA